MVVDGWVGLGCWCTDLLLCSGAGVVRSEDGSGGWVGLLEY